MSPMTLAKGLHPLTLLELKLSTKICRIILGLCGLNRVTLQSEKCRHNRNGDFGRKLREEHKK